MTTKYATNDTKYSTSQSSQSNQSQIDYNKEITPSGGSSIGSLKDYRGQHTRVPSGRPNFDKFKEPTLNKDGLSMPSISENYSSNNVSNFSTQSQAQINTGTGASTISN